MEAAESTGWLLAELVYRKITEDKRNCKSVCHFCGPRLGNVSLETAALGLMSAPSFGFSSSKCFMLKGVGRELGKAWSRAACPLQLTWGSAEVECDGQTAMCWRWCLAPDNLCQMDEEGPERGEVLICHRAHQLPGRGDAGAMLLTWLCSAYLPEVWAIICTTLCSGLVQKKYVEQLWGCENYFHLFGF